MAGDIDRIDRVDCRHEPIAGNLQLAKGFSCVFYGILKMQLYDKSPLQDITTTSSDFNQIRDEGFLLVDKTARINDLVRKGRVFLSRPRRFGKSLLLSTINELFTNGVKNFEGLAIHDVWQQDRYPVVKLSFFGLSDPTTLESELCDRLRESFAGAGFNAAFDIAPQINTISALTARLNYLRGQQKIVLLIDEWDFPLSSHLNDRAAFERNKVILNKFYAKIRDLENIKFLLVTGIARYQETSLFTGQTVTDISMDPRFADLLGYTQDEVDVYFAEHIREAATRLKISTAELCHKLAVYYDGFCFDEDAKLRLYCPLSINKFFQQVVDTPAEVPKFGYYWMESSNTAQALRTFLARVRLKSDFIDQVQGSGVELSQTAISSANSYESINFKALLVQTGYLSIDSIKNPDEVNLEVKQRYVNILLRYLTGADNESSQSSWFTENAERLKAALLQQNMEQVVVALNLFLRALPYDVWSNAPEMFYRTCIAWCLICSLRDDVQQETQNNKGRSDLEFNAGNYHCVVELKRFVPSQGQEKDREHVRGHLRLLADKAQQQVYERGYGFNAQVGVGQPRLGLALVVSTESRQIEYWRYFNGDGVIAEGMVEPISMKNPPQLDAPDTKVQD